FLEERDRARATVRLLGRLHALHHLRDGLGVRRREHVRLRGRRGARGFLAPAAARRAGKDEQRRAARHRFFLGFVGGGEGGGGGACAAGAGFASSCGPRLGASRSAGSGTGPCDRISSPISLIGG